MTLRSTGLQSDSDLDSIHNSCDVDRLKQCSGVHNWQISGIVDFPSFYSPPTHGSTNQAINWYLDDCNSVWYDPHNIYDLYEENGIEWRWSFVSNKCVYCRRDCILVFPEQLLWGQLHYTKTNGRFFTIQNSWRFSHWQKGNGRFFTIIVQLLIDLLSQYFVLNCQNSKMMSKCSSAATFVVD